MYTYGQPISKCASLLDFLKCMYDVLEGEWYLTSAISTSVLTDIAAHRWAVIERNVTHRDISHANIILSAEDFWGKRKDGLRGKENRPIFANEVLSRYV